MNRTIFLSQRISQRTNPYYTTSANTYTISGDKTLTNTQEEQGGVVDLNAILRSHSTNAQAKKGNIPNLTKDVFRARSNPTKQGYSSGYHEAGLTTNMANHLIKRVKEAGTSSVANDTNTPTQLRDLPILENNVSMVLFAGEGLRTDTAQTVLSVPQASGGGATGHSGSGVKTTNQANAHDLLRESTAALLNEKKLTPGVAAVTYGALSVAMMAPGIVASKAEDIKKLKAQHVMVKWESLREEAKARVEAMHAQLTAEEQATVNQHISNVFNNLPDDRRLALGRCTSPVRDKGVITNGISGGGYVAANQDVLPGPKLAPPVRQTGQTMDEHARQATSYFTEPFRTQRRE